MSDAKARGQKIAETADRLSNAFARELAVVLRHAERILQPILREALDGDRSARVSGARGLAVRRQLREALSTAGYARMVDEATVTAVERMAEAMLATRIGQAGVKLVQPNPLKLQALVDIGRYNLLDVADDAARELWRGLATWAFSATPTNQIIDDLLNRLDADVANVHTLFDTQVSMFGRQVEALATEHLPDDQPYLYVGPNDHKNRPFCKELVGQVMTRDRIEALDNEQLPNPFVTGGGYNCRHSWLAVESADLRAMANTGERAPEFALVRQ